MSDDAAYTVLDEAAYLPVARRILTETDPNLPPLEDRIATMLFHAAQSKCDNHYNYRARVAAEVALAGVRADNDRLAALIERYAEARRRDAGQVERRISALESQLGTAHAEILRLMESLRQVRGARGIAHARQIARDAIGPEE